MGLLKHYLIIGRFLHLDGRLEYTVWKHGLKGICGEGVEEYVLDIRKWAIGPGMGIRSEFVSAPNCWEFMGCKNSEVKRCPARRDRRLHGLHGGRNAGRACWMVLDTMCAGEVQSSAVEKQKVCGKCDFMRSVRLDEPEGEFIVMPHE